VEGHPRSHRLILGLRAELAKLVSPNVGFGLLLTVSIALATTLPAYRTASQHLDATATARDISTPWGALEVSALHHASFAGLVLAAVLAAIGAAAEYETGDYGRLLLAEPRRAVLLARKITAGAVVMLLSTLLCAVLLYAAGAVLDHHYGLDSPARTIAAHAALLALARGLVVQWFFLIAAHAAAALTGTTLGCLLAVLGPTMATAPLTRTWLAPYMPHYWVAAWMRFRGEQQFRVFVWNSAPMSSSRTTAVLELAAATLVAIAVLLWRTRGETLTRPRE
jgi:hypothetical protein